MDNGEKDKEKHISMLELKEEELDKEISVAQKKAMIKELKATYGKDWRKIIGGTIGRFRVNAETMQTLHGFGGGGPLGPRRRDD